MRFIWKVLLIVVAVALVAGGATVYLRKEKGSGEGGFRTATVTRGDVTASITANGTVEPEELIDIGAQVAGQIIAFGKDTEGKPIDYGSKLKRDQLLAQLDDTTYKADLTNANAQVASAKAGVTRANADLLQLQAKRLQAERDWARAEKLGPSDALAQAQYDQYQAAFEIAKANVAVGEAAIVQAKAQQDQAQASIERAERNLGYCTIKSPVEGTVIDRRVNIGQTVVASLNAPSLFLIAKDLRRMQVWTAVNEADIGNIKPGQDATFTTDAFPNRTFKGKVGKIRLNATMTSNVVTFTVEVVTDNSDSTLLPYLTANVAFQVARHEGVLMVPNAALRWSPTDADQVAPESRAEFVSMSSGGGRRGGGGGGSGGSGGASGGARGDASDSRPGAPSPSSQPGGRRGGRAGGIDAPPAGGTRQRGMLWTLEGQYVRPIRVRIGVTDGISTEVIADELQEGLAVVTGEVTAGTAPVGTEDAKNPFAPQFRRGGGGGGRRGM